MNRTQKNALGALVIMSLTLTMLAYVFFQLFVLKKTPVVSPVGSCHWQF